MEEEIAFGELLGRQELNDGAVGIGLIAPLACQIASFGGFFGDNLTENVIDRVEEMARAQHHLAGGAVVGEEIGEFGAIVVDIVKMGAGELHTALHLPTVGLVGIGGVGFGLIGNSNRAVVLQPGRVAIGIARQGLIGDWVNLANGGDGLEVGVRKIGIAALAIKQLGRVVSSAGFRNQGRGLANRFDQGHGA